MRTRVLVTGFEPFAGLPRNPSADVVRRLARDARCRRAGVRTGVVPVHRHRAPRALLRLLARHRPEALVLTGLARGRPAICLERIAINCYCSAGGRAAGRPIVPGAPDGLFSTVPLDAARRALSRGGARVVLSGSAGTFTCNLLLFLALHWDRTALPGGGTAPGLVAFVHLPATPESLPRPGGPGTPTVPLPALVQAVRGLALELARRGPVGPRRRGSDAGEVDAGRPA